MKREKKGKFGKQKQKAFTLTFAVLFAALTFVIVSFGCASAASAFSSQLQVSDDEGGYTPDIAVNSTGTIYVAFADDYTGIDFAKSTDGGVTFSAHICAGDTGQLVEDAAIAADGDNVYVVWLNNEDGKIYYARSTDGGESFGAKVQVSDAGGCDGDPEIAVNTSSGVIYVVWDGGDYIYIDKSTDGTTFATDVIVDTDTSPMRSAPSIAIDTENNIHVAGHRSHVYYVKSTDGGATFTPHVQVDDSNYEAYSPSIGIGADGKIYVAWEDLRDISYYEYIYAAVSSDGGTSFSAGVKVDDDTTEAEKRNPDIAVNSDGVFVVWQDGRNNDTNPDIYFAGSLDNGSSFSTNVKVNTITGAITPINKYPTLAVDNTNAYVAWQGTNGSTSTWLIYFAKADIPVCETATKNWTFMVYLDADNNLESAGMDDLNEMEMAGSTSDLNIIVQMDRGVGWTANGVHYDDVSDGDWTGAKRFYVTHNTTVEINSTVVEDLGEVNMGHPDTLSDFINWTIANYPAEHYALVLWDHGSGWESRAPPTQPIKGICSDVQDSDELTMQELESAFAASYANTSTKLDVVGFDACLMGMVEVHYLIKPYADFGVGSEESEPGDGWDYNATLNALKSNTSMTPADLATQIVNDFINSYTDGLPEPADWAGVTQAAVNLTELGDLATTIDSFAQAMMGATADWAAISEARNQADSFSWWYDNYIDLYHFAELVNGNTSISSSVKTAASNIMTAVNDTVIAEGHNTTHNNSHGLSIYYPSTESRYLTTYGDLTFSVDTRWDDFLEGILSGVAVEVYQSGQNIVMDNGLIRVGIYETHGIGYFGGSDGSALSTTSPVVTPRLDKNVKDNDKSNTTRVTYAGDLYIYDEDVAVFSPYGASSGDICLDEIVDSANETSTYNEVISSGARGEVKQNKTGMINGIPVIIERYISLEPNQKFITIRFVVKNNGSSPINNVEMYHYLDMDLAGCGNDKVMVPLVDGTTPYLTTEETFNSSQLGDNWVYQRDVSQDRHVGLLTRTATDPTNIYITKYAYGGAEEPPARVNVNGQGISAADCVWAVGWRRDIPVGGEATVYYGLAAPANRTELISMSDQFTSEGVSASLNAPSEAMQGDTISVSADVDNLYNTAKTINVTLTLPDGLSLLSGALLTQVNVAANGQASLTWSVGVNESATTGDKELSVNATVVDTGLSATASATVLITPSGSIQYQESRTGLLLNDANKTCNVTLPSDTLYATGNVTLYPCVDMVFLEGVTGLIAYPYGCVEQIVSRQIANVQIYTYLKTASKLVSSGRRSELERSINKGKDMMIDQQHADNGWGWYERHSSTPFFTSYALMGLLHTQEWYNDEQVGQQVDGNYIGLPSPGGKYINTAITNGTSWLIASQNTDGSWTGISPDYIEEQVQLTTYNLITLSQAAALGYNQPGIVSGMDNATTNATAYLVSVQNEDGGWGATPSSTSEPYTTSLAIKALIAGSMSSSNTTILNGTQWLTTHKTGGDHWELAGGCARGWFGHIPETTSLAVMALIDAGTPTTDTNVSAAFNYLVDNSRLWMNVYSTKDPGTTIWMFNELVEHGLTIGAPDITVNTTVNGHLADTAHFTTDTTKTFNVTGYLNITANANNTFNFTSTGTGNITYQVSIDYWVPLSRSRLVMVLTREGDAWIVKEEMLGSGSGSCVGAKAGNRNGELSANLSLNKTITPSPLVVNCTGTVTLNFTSAVDNRYIVIDDYIPSGFSLNETQITPAGIAYEGTAVTGTGTGDKISFALQNISAGQSIVITYGIDPPSTELTNVSVRSAEAFLMYQPTIKTVSGARTVDVIRTIKGDVDGNPGVTMIDAMYLAKHVVGLPGFETIDEYAADVDGNPSVTMIDAMYLAKHVVGLPGFETLQ